jgi:hypothetical protein
MFMQHTPHGKHDIEGGRVEELHGSLLQAIVFYEVSCFMASRFLGL